MDKGKIHICCNIDDNYAQHCGVMLTSLFNKTGGKQLDIHILISKLSEENKKNLTEVTSKYNSFCHFHKIDSSILKGVIYRENRKLSEATYYRLLMSSVLDNSISRVLYIDSDIIIMNDITELFSLDISDYALAATRDLEQLTDERRFDLSLPQGSPYFNAGMMLVNLDFWRKTGAEKKLIEFAKIERKVTNHDQDALNAVFRGKWFMLSPRWNRFSPYIYDKSFFENNTDKKEFEKNPVLIHFVDYFKPWNNIHWIGKNWSKFRHLYYIYLKQTPWKDFKPGRLNIEKYADFGLYKYLVVFSVKKMLLGLLGSFSLILKTLEKLFFMPFMATYKLFHALHLNMHRDKF